MTEDPGAALLAKAELFRGLQEDVLRSIAADALGRRYAKGEVIFRQDDPATTFLVIVEGTVKVFVTSPRGEEMVLATLRPPESLGEVSLLDGGRRSASAAAIDQVTTLSFARSTLLELMARERAVADAVLRASGRLLRRLTGQAADLVFLDLEGRVAKLLVDMFGERDDDEMSLDLGETRQDLASMVGGSAESVDQILDTLAGHGFIRLEGQMVTIVEKEALRRRAGL